MFSFFKSKPKTAKYTYFTYMTTMEKYWNYIESVKNLLGKESVVLVYYFQDTRAELIKLLESAGIDFEEDAMPYDNKNKASLWNMKRALKQNFDADCRILVAEVFPVWSMTMDFVASQPIEQDIVFYASLDSVFFEVFGGDRLRSLMEKMGLQQNEKIEHSMVTKSIERAQEKLEEQASQPEIDTSIEEWAEINKINLK